MRILAIPIAAAFVAFLACSAPAEEAAGAGEKADLTSAAQKQSYFAGYQAGRALATLGEGVERAAFDRAVAGRQQGNTHYSGKQHQHRYRIKK